MNANRCTALALACALLFAGCATQRERIGKRIGQKAEFFAALPSEKQQLLREGKVSAGDPSDAVWIVYGKPDRVFKKVTGASTNELWSYIACDPAFNDAPHPAMHPLTPPRGRPFWRPDTFWATDLYYHPYEYLRIEFQNGRVLSLESEQH